MKKLLWLLTALTLTLALASCSQNKDYISEDEAKAKALSHAQFKEDDVKFVKSQLEQDDGRAVYEIEFFNNGEEYDYEIDAKTGDILSYDREAEGYQPNTSKGDKAEPSKEVENAGAGTSDNEDIITADEALDIALKQVEGATKDNARVEKDYDDGRIYYDVKIVLGSVEYEFEIDAKTGEITERDKDSIYD